MKISLITVCYNSAKTIKTAIESVLTQQGVDLEYIVVDGGSKDDTVSVASFVNTKNSVPDTGDSSRVIALSATAVCAVLGMTGLVLFRRKRNGAFS